MKYVVAVLLLASSFAQADTYKCIDAKKKVTYSNDPCPATTKNVPLGRSSLTVVPAQRPRQDQTMMAMPPSNEAHAPAEAPMREEPAGYTVQTPVLDEIQRRMDQLKNMFSR